MDERLFTAMELAVLSDGAAWIWNVCEEIFSGQNPTFILDQFHALEYATATVQVLTLDEGERQAWTEGSGNSRTTGRLPALSTTRSHTADGTKPSRPASTNSKPTRIGCAATAAGSADCRSDPASWKAPASISSGVG